MTNFAITSVGALGQIRKHRAGQSLVEYALILSFVSFTAIALLSVMGPQIRGICSPIIRTLAAVCAAL